MVLRKRCFMILVLILACSLVNALRSPAQVGIPLKPISIPF